MMKLSVNHLPDLIPQNPFSILRRPYKMVSRIINRMAQSFDAHAAYYTKLTSEEPFHPRASARGIQG